jgi:hypothetical protein
MTQAWWVLPAAPPSASEHRKRTRTRVALRAFPPSDVDRED